VTASPGAWASGRCGRGPVLRRPARRGVFGECQISCPLTGDRPMLAGSDPSGPAAAPAPRPPLTILGHHRPTSGRSRPRTSAPRPPLTILGHHRPTSGRSRPRQAHPAHRSPFSGTTDQPAVAHAQEQAHPAHRSPLTILGHHRPTSGRSRPRTSGSRWPRAGHREPPEPCQLSRRAMSSWTPGPMVDDSVTLRM